VFVNRQDHRRPLYEAQTIRSKLWLMRHDEVIQLLLAQRSHLVQQYGVQSIMLFGSVARDAATQTSDVDLLVEFGRPVGYFGLFALQDYLSGLLGKSVDLGTPKSLKPYMRERVMQEQVNIL
jgi:uncharacterized protein